MTDNKTYTMTDAEVIEHLRQQLREANASLAECQAELAKAKENDVCAYSHRRHQQEQYKDD